ncbi:hypothetical protein SAMN05443377_1202 [Propionibacterium cyclohexanicum]|uniref:Uncharacterized protein n=1 Tax=Propionibacterium cyclohexanicum TaxID=64702 RepID=A0A1H9T9N5_9ACTN|nr:hypothetical protein SAMN05443377_1202 [Propionibacterium cyclohexanicum]
MEIRHQKKTQSSHNQNSLHCEIPFPQIWSPHAHLSKRSLA